MKRLGLYAIISIMLVVGFGGFLSPQKSFAAVTQEQVNSFVSEAVTILNSPPANDLAKLSTDDINKYTSQMNATADSAFRSPDNNASMTIDRFRASLGDQFRALLYSGGAYQQGLAIYNKLQIPAQNAVNVSNGSITAAQASASNAQAAARQTSWEETATSKASGCTVLGWSIVKCLDAGFSWLIKNTLLELAGFLVWLSANMLNLAIQIGILGFSQWAPDTLYPIWMVVRQIVSLFIVFAGLWLGFMYIIGRDEKFRQYIPWVIIFALFVNFSYPLSRALIDVSNVISLNVYSSAIGNDALTSSDPNNTAGALIMNKLGLQGLVASATSVKANTTTGFADQINSTPGALVAVIFVVYAAYVFFMATAIIAVRTAVLVFLVIASPILFVDSVIPKLGDEAAKLRKMYFEQLVVAPVFMIMLALTLKFLEVFQSGPIGTVTGTLSAAASAGSVTVFFNILMMLIMLHIMLKVTKSVSGSVGQAATNFMGKVGGFGLGVATGGAGLLARNTLGNAAASLRDSKWVTNNQDSFLGRRAYNMSNSLANSTFDARNTDLIGGRMSKAGMGMGTGAKLGYDKEREARDKDKLDRYDRTGTFRKNWYDTEGRLHRKGEVDTSNTAAKERFYSNAGGVLLGRNDLRAKLDLSRKSQRLDTVSEYSKLEDEEKKEYFSKQNKETQEKLLAYDAKSAKGDNKEFNKEQDRKETLQVNKSMAESQKELADAMRGTEGKEKAEGKKTEPLPPGYEATPSGILIPSQKSSVSPKEGGGFDMKVHSFADRVAERKATDNTKTPTETANDASNKKVAIDFSNVKPKM